MLNGLRGRLTYSNVMSTIAVFLALGGGVALAVRGKGSLQRAGIDGLPTSFTDVSALKGFGKIQARCDTADNTVEVRFISTSSEWRVFGESNVDQLVNLSVEPGETDETVDVAGASAFEKFDLHISKAVPDSRAQVDLTLLGAGPPFDDDCTPSLLRVLALNTQQG